MEQNTVSLCQRNPTFNSTQIVRRLGHDAPSTRTIQRIRKRNRRARLPKRAPPHTTARKLSPHAAEQVQALLNAKPYLGPDRLTWDLLNSFLRWQ